MKRLRAGGLAAALILAISIALVGAPAGLAPAQGSLLDLILEYLESVEEIGEEIIPKPRQSATVRKFERGGER